MYIREVLIFLLVILAKRTLSETRIKIGIADTGIIVNEETKPWLCKDKWDYDYTGYGIKDVHGHGTNVAGLVVNGLSYNEYCIVVYKFYHTKETYKESIKSLYSMWTHLQTVTGISYMNMSFDGKEFISLEYKAIKGLLDKGGKVTVAAGNNSKSLDKKCDMFPVCYKFKGHFYRVGAIDGTYGNVGKILNAYELGTNQTGFGITLTGTSQATANFLNRLIKRDKVLNISLDKLNKL
jgi:hypothetical protein